MKTAIAFCLVLFACQYISAQNKQDKSDINVILKCRKQYKKDERKYVTILIENKSGDSIFIPDNFCSQPIMYADYSPMVIDVRKCDKFKNNVAYNYDCIEPDRELIVLAPNETRLYKQYIGVDRPLREKGKYKVRAIVNLSKYITCSVVRTKWCYFEVE